MAAGAWTAYSKSVLALTKGSFNLSSDTLVLILATGSYTPAPNTDALYSDVSANELATANGYTVGGVALSSVTDTLATATTTLTSAAATWSAFSATFRYGVIIRRAGGSLVSGDLLLAYSDLGGGSNITGGGGTLTVTMNASGILQVTHSP